MIKIRVLFVNSKIIQKLMYQNQSIMEPNLNLNKNKNNCLKSCKNGKKEFKEINQKISFKKNQKNQGWKKIAYMEEINYQMKLVKN